MSNFLASTLLKPFQSSPLHFEARFKSTPKKPTAGSILVPSSGMVSTGTTVPPAALSIAVSYPAIGAGVSAAGLLGFFSSGFRVLNRISHKVSVPEKEAPLELEEVVVAKDPKVVEIETRLSGLHQERMKQIQSRDKIVKAYQDEKAALDALKKKVETFGDSPILAQGQALEKTLAEYEKNKGAIPGKETLVASYQKLAESAQQLDTKLAAQMEKRVQAYQDLLNKLQLMEQQSNLMAMQKAHESLKTGLSNQGIPSTTADDKLTNTIDAEFYKSLALVDRAIADSSAAEAQVLTQDVTALSQLQAAVQEVPHNPSGKIKKVGEEP
ncbi:MAG: hypothetical protein K2X66_17065 [Cyanobacteria bacterium]|nr:hypothetical protein [Cyanobacteriota bacterium]